MGLHFSKQNVLYKNAPSWVVEKYGYLGNRREGEPQYFPQEFCFWKLACKTLLLHIRFLGTLKRECQLHSILKRDWMEVVQ